MILGLTSHKYWIFYFVSIDLLFLYRYNNYNDVMIQWVFEVNRLLKGWHISLKPLHNGMPKSSSSVRNVFILERRILWLEHSCQIKNTINFMEKMRLCDVLLFWEWSPLFMWRLGAQFLGSVSPFIPGHQQAVKRTRWRQTDLFYKKGHSCVARKNIWHLTFLLSLHGSNWSIMSNTDITVTMKISRRSIW